MKRKGFCLFQISLDTGNPFIAHEIYKTTRKLAFPETIDQRRRVISDMKELDNSSINTTNYDSNFVDYKYVDADYAQIEKKL